MTAPRQTIFDQSHYLRLIEARGETIRRMVKELKPALNLSTAMDAGCGVGFFSETLRECGLQVRAFDGRIENVAEARKRFPQISFEQGDVQNSEIRDLGPLFRPPVSLGEPATRNPESSLSHASSPFIGEYVFSGRRAVDAPTRGAVP